MSSSTSVPENQPPHSVTSAAFRIGSMTSGSLGKRRPISMPVKPAERDCRRHSSSDTSSLSSARSSFHHAMGDMPSLAFKSSLQLQFACAPCGGESALNRRRSAAAASLIGLARRVDLASRGLTSGTATSHQWPPASVETSGSVSMTITVVRSFCFALRQRRFQLGDRRHLLARPRPGLPHARQSRCRAAPRGARPSADC